MFVYCTTQLRKKRNSMNLKFRDLFLMVFHQNEMIWKEWKCCDGMVRMIQEEEEEQEESCSEEWLEEEERKVSLWLCLWPVLWKDDLVLHIDVVIFKEL